MADFARSLRITLSKIAPKGDVHPIPPIWATFAQDIDAINISDFVSTGLLIGIDSPETLARLLPNLRKLLEDAEEAGVDCDVELILP